MTNIQGHRPERPPGVKVALGLAIGSFVLWLVVVTEMIPPGNSVIVPALAAMGFHLAGTVRAFRGRKDTRIGVIVSLLVVLFFLLPFCWLGFRFSGRSVDGASCAVADIIAFTASAAGLALLFAPSSRRYFHLVTVARAARQNASRHGQ